MHDTYSIVWEGELMYSVLQKNIKKHLQKKNISVTELERRAGLRHAVINIMHGRSKNPSAKITFAIAKELDCSVEDLFTDEEILTPVKVSQTTEDKTDNTPTWDARILTECVSMINQKISQQKSSPNLDLVLSWVRQAFCYAKSEPSNKVEERFIDWLITNS
jgi:transcriptional regulator with XRE-family HTH domain